MRTRHSAPIGISLLRGCCSTTRANKDVVYRIFILTSTFIAYACFHMTRRPVSIAKNSLHQNCSNLPIPPGTVITNSTKDTWCSWAPFDGDNAEELFGILDAAYLFAYAGAMFISGFIAERMHLRYFLSLGMILSGLFTHLFGLGYSLKIHSFAYYVIIQTIGGAVQSTGWPAVVTCVGNWFGKSKRGLIFGVWNAHTSIGNIMGAGIAGAYVASNWGMSFLTPGLICGIVGFLMFLFITPYPEEVGCDPPVRPPDSLTTSTSSSRKGGIRRQLEEVDAMESSEGNDQLSDSNLEEKALIQHTVIVRTGSEGEQAITFFDALRIPGVIEFSLSLFFAKLVSYTFLFWLPKYIKASTSLGSADSAYLSTPFDFGGIIGGIVAGHISDKSNASALTCVAFFTLAIPSMFIYEAYGKISVAWNIILQLIAGALVNGPYALITTAVSAELGTHPSIKGSAKALATVSAIIDGTGSIGAAIGPLVAGMISGNWTNFFYMVMVSDLLALLFLLRISWKEFLRFRSKRASL